jgi:uncharacterized membrane protein YphA (DoxX/SURF4 family)
VEAAVSRADPAAKGETAVDAPNRVGNALRVSPVPFANVDRRTFLLRATLLAATFLGLIASLPVWMNTRSFPLLPIFPGFPVLPSPADRILVGLMLASLVAALWFYRQAVVVFLAATFFAWCEDQNRGQPWLYMYWVMLLLSLFPTPSATAACRCAISIVYVWSGIQKMNERFFAVVPNWFVAPAEHWHLPPVALPWLRLAVTATPFIELAIGLLLWFPRLRRGAFVATILVHLAAILFLGPLGHNYNWVVWPWNLAMIALVFGLFARGKPFEHTAAGPDKLRPDDRAKKLRKPAATGQLLARFGQTFAELRRSRPALIVVLLYALLPILSYSGRWDSYFSFSLYSENLAVANLFVTESFRDNVPPPLRRYVKKFPEPFDPQHQGPFSFAYAEWAYEEMHVPPISEPRNYFAIYRALQPYAKAPGDLRMLIGPRSGPVIFQEGDRSELLERSR